MFFDYSKLTKRIREKFVSCDSFAKAVGFTREQVKLKLSCKKDFKQCEIRKICEVLDISPNEITAYFFTKKVQ